MPDDRGSITVEATLIMLVCLWVVFMIMMSAFYLYDMNRLDVIAEGLLEKEIREFKGDYDWEDRANCLEENLRRELESGFFFIEADSTAVVNENKVSLDYYGVWKCPIQLWVFANAGFEYHKTIVHEREYPEKILRIVQGIIKGLGD